jgi:uncharacterized membrane protein YeaQ/YmgE (transglycosylase-associated protein family)
MLAWQSAVHVRRVLMAPGALVVIAADGTAWAWFLAGIVGAAVGATASIAREGSRFGCLGNLVLGVVGALIGEWILDLLFDVHPDDVIWVVITAFIGAAILVIVVGTFTEWRSSGNEEK